VPLNVKLTQVLSKPLPAGVDRDLVHGDSLSEVFLGRASCNIQLDRFDHLPTAECCAGSATAKEDSLLKNTVKNSSIERDASSFITFESSEPIRGRIDHSVVQLRQNSPKQPISE
jgi:hypothetical protein